MSLVLGEFRAVALAFGPGSGCRPWPRQSCSSGAGQWLQLKSSPPLQMGTGLQLLFQSVELCVVCDPGEEQPFLSF